MLDVICTHCGKVLKIPEEYLGQKGKCNHCQGEITVTVAPLKFSAQAIEAETKREEEKAASTSLASLGDAKPPSHSFETGLEEPKPPPPQVQSKMTAKTFATAGCGCGCMGLVAVFILLAIVGARASKNPDGTRDYKIEASAAAQMAVERQLKSPGSAKHPWAAPQETTTYIGNSQYRVKSYVDSQNSFGASVRTKYTAVVQVDGPSKATIVSLETE